MKILVIDDESPTLSMFRLFLETYQHEVLTAENGEDGLKLFERETPPVVLTDIKMPGMDGIEVLKRIKQSSPLTEVIIITGHGDMELAIQALNLDAADFVHKPIQKTALDKALERAAERIRLNESQSGRVSGMEEDGLYVIEIGDNITSRTEPLLLEELNKALKTRLPLLVSFNENVSLNGAGMAVFTQILRECNDENIPTALTGLSENFSKVFEIVGIARLTSIHESKAQAREWLKA
ncbi:MAG: response regulator [Desulfovibrio sp.]|uniref:response regulator n=1 Tax=Desulfovibrio sp. 7SRBS1 TaxID=3378064 RepID=UPI003B3C9110